MTHQLFKRDGFLDHFGLGQNELGNIALDHHRLDLGHALVVAVVPTHHVIGTLVAGGQLLDVGLDLLGLHSGQTPCLGQRVVHERTGAELTALVVDGVFAEHLAPTLHKKAHNYGERGIDLGELDLLAFASLKRSSLDLNSPFPPPTEYLRQGWRSLSLVGPNFVRVLFAHAGAPDFLRNNLGRSVLLDVGISL